MIPEIRNPLKNARLITKNYPVEEYLKNTALGRSDICAFSANPSKWKSGAKEDGTNSTEWGSLVDCLLLSPSDFDSRYVVPPETYPDKKTGNPKPWNFNADYCDRWLSEQEGKSVVKRNRLSEATEAVKKILNDEQLSTLIGESFRQVFCTAEYHDEETGLAVGVKCLIDIVPDRNSGFAKSLFDLKTANDASPANWRREVFNRGYHVQGALSLDIYTAATGEDRCDFRHIIQENYPPYDVSKRFLSEEFIQLGRHFYISALKRYCQCAKSGNWPGYCDPSAMVLDDGFEAINPEAWMVTA